MSNASSVARYRKNNQEKVRLASARYRLRNRAKLKETSDLYRLKNQERRIWYAMIQRCENAKNTAYHSYGGRGISVCERWRSDFGNFLNDMGHRPSPMHSIDRIDNDGNYEPGNCRWATRAQQQANRRCSVLIAVDGESLTASEWARRVGARPELVSQRIYRGWSIDTALRVPTRAQRSRAVDDAIGRVLLVEERHLSTAHIEAMLSQAEINGPGEVEQGLRRLRKRGEISFWRGKGWIKVPRDKVDGEPERKAEMKNRNDEIENAILAALCSESNFGMSFTRLHGLLKDIVLPSQFRELDLALQRMRKRGAICFRSGTGWTRVIK